MRFLGVSVPVLTLAIASPAQAQDVKPKMMAVGLGEIVVTAQRRAESSQKAALSITALRGEELREAAKDTVASAIRDVPAVVVQGNSNGAQIYVRGVGSNADSQLGDAAVNLNVDGVYQQETEVPTMLMFDVARVEVLRGPQGTLYGRNATAGAINIVTQDPNFDHVGGFATLQGGNFGNIHSEAALNLPVATDVALRASFASEDHEGYLSNGNNDAHVRAGRLKLLARPTEKLKISLAGDYLHSFGNGQSSVEAPLASHPAYTSTTPKGYLRLTAWNVRGQADYDFDFATLTTQLSHNDFAKNDANVLLSPVGISSRREGRQESAELRLSSKPNSPVKWVAGAYFLNNLEYMRATSLPVSFPTVAAGDPELRNARTRSYALFSNVTVPLADHLRATAGLRYTKDRKSAEFFCAAACTGVVSAATTWGSVTYKAGLEADLASQSLVYAQVSSGFKAGGYAQQFPAGTYNPEKLTAFEVGSKNRFVGNRLQINGSAFYYNYSNYQASYPDIVSGTFAIVTKNASTAKVYGFELESKFQITPNDQIGASVSLLHAQFGAFSYTSVLSGSVDHSNQTMPNAPGFAADLSYEHRFELGGLGTLTAHADTHITDGYWVSVERPLDSYQSAYTRSNAFVSYTPANTNVNIRLFVRNLENKAVRTLALANPFDKVLLLAPPRTFGGSVTVNF